MVGKTLDELGVADEVIPTHYSVKESVFPFNKFPGCDIILGPEMKSTGEVMGIDHSMPMAFAKAMMAANTPLPTEGTIFVSIAGQGKQQFGPIAKKFTELGFKLLATPGTAEALKSWNVPTDVIPKIQEGARPNILDKMKNGEIAMVINTPTGRGNKTDEALIRSTAVAQRITCITTLSAAYAAMEACEVLINQEVTVTALQEWHPNPLQAGPSHG
jgi:carbamoyl-phosphate synthase large subunit